MKNSKSETLNSKQVQNSKSKNQNPLFRFIGILVIVICLGFSASDFGFNHAYAANAQKEYDGIWFLGFNLHKDLFSDNNSTSVKKALNLAINRPFICNKIISDPLIPTGVIPAGMPGYDSALKGYPFDLKYAKELMKAAGYSLNDPRIKNINLLHTDGKKTIEIAKAIEKNLAQIGIKLTRVQFSYQDNQKWSDALSSGQYHMFLMGYKANVIGTVFVGDKDTKFFHLPSCTQLPSSDNQIMFNTYAEAVATGYAACPVCNPEIEEEETDTFSLLQPLFHSAGSANFTFYRNAKVDTLFDQIAANPDLPGDQKTANFKEINSIIQSDPPTVNLFYITKL
ncbi:MAG: ABC transporter substrate-binding protein [Candidatus Saganbacteria bacterium]|nr:ABC transporter substrate-binding protein [Candidatus Saganbacteria bacterium]